MTPAQSRAARALVGWSQEELARNAGITRSSVAHFELELRQGSQRLRDCKSNSSIPTPQRLAQHVPRPKPSQGARLGREAPIAPQAEQPEQATSWRDHGSALAQWTTTSFQPTQHIALLVGDILRDHVASANSQASCASDFEPLNAQN